MANFNSKKTKPLLAPDWTRMDDKSEPFYQAASGSFSERYSVTVLSAHSTTGGPQLENRKNVCKEPGLTRILKYYSKVSSGSIENHVFAEDYYISERPTAKMKVLVSLPCTYLEALPEQVSQTQLENLGPVNGSIDLNTYDLGTKIEIAGGFLAKYKAEIEQFYGRVYDIDFDEEITKLNSFLPALTSFLRENEIIYSSSNSDLITLYINKDYKVLMTKINQGTGYIDLIKGYNNFIENSGVNNDRTIFLLSKLDELQKVSILNKPLSWSKFLESYIYRPPSIDFSKPPPRSYWKKKPVHEQIVKEQKRLAQTGQEIQSFRNYLDTPEVRAEIQKELAVAQNFVGDTVLSNLDQLSSFTKDMEDIYNNFFNRMGLDGLINSAVQCLDIPQIGSFVFGVPQDILDTLTEAAEVIQGVFNPPTMAFPSNFPVTDFMGDMIWKMLVGVLDSMLSMLITMIKEIIKSLFDFCNDCAVTDKEGNKSYSNLAFGQSSFLGLIGGALVVGVEANLETLVLGSFNNSMKEVTGGDVELLSQQVLKDSIRNRAHIYGLEAEEIYSRYQSGELPKAHRLALDEKIDEIFSEDWSLEQASLLGVSGQEAYDIRDLFDDARVTKDKIALLIKNEEPWETGVFKNAAQEVTDYLELSSTVLTPGEIGNALMGCNVGSEAKEVMRNALPEFPNIHKILSGENDEETDNNIAGLMSGFSNIIPNKAIIEQVNDAVKGIPAEFNCLCDVDDTALRSDYLAKKDPQMSPDERSKQVKQSQNRKRDRLKDLAGMLGKDNILAGLIPPLVCSGSYDINGNPVIEQGFLPSTHPVTQFMVKQTLDTIYDPLHTSFTRDLKGMLPAMSQKPLIKEDVARTRLAIDKETGDEFRVFDLTFVDMVSKGMVSYGSLPAGSVVPGSSEPPNDGQEPQDSDAEATQKRKGTEIYPYNWFLTSLGFEWWANPMGAGMWEEGQTKPTPEQEYEWERKNVSFSSSYDKNGNLVSKVQIGGRRFIDEPKGGVLGYKFKADSGWFGGGGIATKDDGDEYAVSMKDYTKKYGYSPIPVQTYNFGDLTYAPGLKTSYANMCKNFQHSNDLSELSSEIFKIKDTSNSTNYTFTMPNIMDSFGLEFDEMARNLAKIGGDVMQFKGSQGNMDVDPAALKGIVDGLEKMAGSSFNFIYNVKGDDGTPDLQKDKFSLDFQVLPPASADPKVSEKLTNTINMSGPPLAIPINLQAQKIIEQQRNLVVARNPQHSNIPVQPQKGYFYDFAKSSWLHGNTIYRNGESVQQVSPTDTPWSLQTGFLDSAKGDDFVQFLYSEAAYKNLFADLFCAFTNQISDSPYLNLQTNDKGQGLLGLNLSPAKIVGNDPLCYRTLLDVDLIKRRVLEEYEYVKCFREAFKLNSGDIDTLGLVGSKDTAFEVSNRAGCILLTIRLYVIEFLLRSIYTFHYFVLGKGADADATSVYYLYHQIVDGLASRSIGTAYYSEFQRETIELYNRNNEGSPLGLESTSSPHPTYPNYKIITYDHFKTAIEYFIKNQLYSVSKRLSKHVDLMGDGSPHSILLEKWLPTVDPPKYAGEPRFAEQVEVTEASGDVQVKLRNKVLGSYMEVAGIPEISDEVWSSIKPGGTLTDKRIASIRGVPGARKVGEDWIWGMLYMKATGAFFREYFAPNWQIESARDLLKNPDGSSATKPSEMYAAIRSLSNQLWSPSAGSGERGSTMTGHPQYRGPKGLWSYREGRLLGCYHNVFCRAGLTQILTPREQMGTLGQVGFPFNERALEAAKAESIFPAGWSGGSAGLTILDGYFPFGVSQAEKNGMIGDGGTIPGGLTRFIEAAKNWTMGLVHGELSNDVEGFDNLISGGHYSSGEAPSGGSAGLLSCRTRALIVYPRPPPATWTNEEHGLSNLVEFANDFTGVNASTQRLREAPEESYVIYAPTTTPWWWRGYEQEDQSFINNGHRINYLQSSKFYGPGSLLWAFSKEREWSETSFGIGEMTKMNDAVEVHGGEFPYAHGVGAFGIVNDFQRIVGDAENTWPLEYVETMGDRKGQSYVKYNSARLPFLVDWHNYVLGKAGSPGVAADRIDRTLSPNHEITKNVEYVLRRVEMGIQPYISLMDLDTETILRTLEWEQIQYQNMVKDMELVNGVTTIERRAWSEGKIPEAWITLADFNSYSLRVLQNAAKYTHQDMIGSRSSRSLRAGPLHGLDEGFRRAEHAWSMKALFAFCEQPKENMYVYQRVSEQYDIWIDEITQIREQFEDAEEQRECMAQPAKDLIASGRGKRNEMKIPPTFDISNGNIILEPYIRVEDYELTNEQTAKFRANIGYAQVRHATKEDGVNNRVAGQIQDAAMLRGVVNIDLWDDYMRHAFGPGSDLEAFPRETGKAPRTRITQQSFTEDDCGDELPNRQEDFGERFIGEEAGDYIEDKLQLRDFFKSLHFGLRISYLSKPDHWAGPRLWADLTQEDFSGGASFEGTLNSLAEKTYRMTEKGQEKLNVPGRDDLSDHETVRNVYLTPLTAVEIPINMFTVIENDTMFPPNGFGERDSGRSISDGCAGVDPKPILPTDQALIIGYFRDLFGKPKKNSRGHNIPNSIPRNTLQRQLEQADEYAFLFKYAFSMDRMLSLTNLYSATYLSSLPDINNLFATSKENLMYIFINSLNSGKWADACQTGNKELLDALLNGIDVPWAALLGMILKFPLKIFKAFMEQSDINIAISKNIQKAIKALNAIIATAQRQANAMQKAGAAAYAAGEKIAGMEVDIWECGFGIHSPESTQKPPNDWFNPIRETFIPMPETYQLGLALLPATIFAPWLWGPPITLPHGLAYWALDHSKVNWLDAYIDDMISQMQKDDRDPLPSEKIDEPCEIDYGLEFGLAPRPGEQKMFGVPQGLTGDDDGGNNNDGGTGGGSSYG